MLKFFCRFFLSFFPQLVWSRDSIKEIFMPRTADQTVAQKCQALTKEVNDSLQVLVQCMWRSLVYCILRFAPLDKILLSSRASQHPYVDLRCLISIV